MTYICCDCHLEKDEKEFCLNKSEIRGRDYFCKACKAIKKHNFYYSKLGVIQTIWDSQLLSCRIRNHNRPEYTKEELKLWLLSNQLFHELYSNWEVSGFSKDLKPSIDRLDNTKTYSFTNIRLVTFKENMLAANRDHSLNINGFTSCRAVLQFSKEGIFIAEYPSASLAAKQVPNTSRQNIQKVCHNERPLCGGYKWKFKN